MTLSKVHRSSSWIAVLLSLFAATCAVAQPVRDSSMLSVERSAVPARISRTLQKRPPAVASPVVGYEIVAGPIVSLAPLSIAGATAQCPANKVALSAGIDTQASGDATFGLEVLGAWADGARTGEVRVRNANVFVPAQIQAYVVCIADTPGRRQVDLSTAPQRSTQRAVCAESERIAGGGIMTRDVNLWLQRSGPYHDAQQNQTMWLGVGWRNVNMGLQPTFLVRALCYPALAVRGWQLVEGPRVSLGAHGKTTLSVTCPPGTVALAAGVMTVGEDFDSVWNTLVPSLGGTVTARVHNRNLVDSNGNAFVQINAVCADRA